MYITVSNKWAGAGGICKSSGASPGVPACPGVSRGVPACPQGIYNIAHTRDSIALGDSNIYGRRWIFTAHGVSRSRDRVGVKNTKARR